MTKDCIKLRKYRKELKRVRPRLLAEVQAQKLRSSIPTTFDVMMTDFGAKF